jgi:hypothetical protein
MEAKKKKLLIFIQSWKMMRDIQSEAGKSKEKRQKAC